MNRTSPTAVRFAGEPARLAAALAASLPAPDPAHRAAGARLAARHSRDAAATAHADLYRGLLAGRRPAVSPTGPSGNQRRGC